MRAVPTGGGTRMPKGECGQASAPNSASAFRTFSCVAFSVLTRRSAGARSASLRPCSMAVSPKAAVKLGHSHSGTSAWTWGGASCERTGEACAFGLAQRFGGVVLSVAGSVNSVGLHAEGGGRCADGERAWAVSSHRPGDRGAAAQCIVDEAADGIAVAGAGEAMGFAPVCERDALPAGAGSRSFRELRLQPRCARRASLAHPAVKTWMASFTHMASSTRLLRR